jgi:anti-sigma regulatory factor (Ser/Thr protein kinase)
MRNKQGRRAAACGAEKYCMTVEAKEENLGLVRSFIGAGMKKKGFPENDISALKLAVTEHFENLIRHAYGKKRGTAGIEMELKKPAARITVRDEGPAFDMRGYEVPDTFKRVKKGLGGKMGIKTILALCDAVEYRRKNKRNENSFIIRGSRPGKREK